MAADKSGLQMSTIGKLLMAHAPALPVSIQLAGTPRVLFPQVF